MLLPIQISILDVARARTLSHEEGEGKRRKAENPRGFTEDYLSGWATASSLVTILRLRVCDVSDHGR